MVNLPFQIIYVARPIHWVKNFALFGALLLTGTLFEKGLFKDVLLAFISFSFATSATYIFNDIMDAKADILHPVKKNRPVSSGKLPVIIAILELLSFLFLSLLIAFALNDLLFTLILSAISMYVCLQDF